MTVLTAATIERAVLLALLADHPQPVPLTELERAFEGDHWRSALNELVASGLAVEDSAGVRASRTAARADELLG